MVQEASLEFRLRKIDETRNYLLGEIKQNDIISEIRHVSIKIMVKTCLF